MLIKLLLYSDRAVSDFVFVFCSLITLKKLQSVTETKYWHTIFSRLFSFTWRYNCVLSEYSSKPSVFTCFVCIWSFGRARSSKCICLSVLERAAHAHTHTRAHTLQPEEKRLSCGLYFQRFIIKHVQQFSNCKERHFYNNRQTIDLILTLSFGQGGTNAHRCEREGSCVRRNTAIIFRS